MIRSISVVRRGVIRMSVPNGGRTTAAMRAITIAIPIACVHASTTTRTAATVLFDLLRWARVLCCGHWSSYDECGCSHPYLFDPRRHHSYS